MERAKRPRPVLSCIPCRARKLKCNRASPCEQCVKAGRVEECTFTSAQSHLDTRQPAESLAVPVAQPKKRQFQEVDRTDAHIPSTPGLGVIEDLQLRVKLLEDAISTGSFVDLAARQHAPAAENSDPKVGKTLEVDGTKIRYHGGFHRKALLLQVIIFCFISFYRTLC
jgi:hypothetical protein